MKKFFLLVTSAIVIFTSCSTEFNPNTNWKETMLVYGLLDQDCDTTWVRVQKCFLGEGNANDFAQIMDSSCYKESALTVRINEWSAINKNGILTKTSQTGVVFNFQYTMLNNKPVGDFYAPNQPVYYCETKGMLKTDKVYELEILNNETGVKVTSETSLIGGAISLLKPDSFFQFNSGNKNNRTVILKWTTDEDHRARIFQPVVRFFYWENGVLKYVDIKASQVRNSNNYNELQMSLVRSTFGAELKEKIGVNPSVNRLIADSVHIFIHMGNEILSNYMSVSAPPSSIVQERPTFSNINGGLGIFASRRTKVKEMREVPKAVNSEYREFLKSLGLGF